MLLRVLACFSVVSMLSLDGMVAQNQVLADSLIQVYQHSLKERENLDLIRQIAESETNPDSSLYYSNILISKAKKRSDKDFLRAGYLQRGNAFQLKGDFTEALENFLEALQLAQIKDDNGLIGGLQISIADTYSIIGNSENAEVYYSQGIENLRKSTDSVALASALLNSGDDYFKNEQYNQAIDRFSESKSIFDALNFDVGIAYNYGNLGMVYANQGKLDLAFFNLTTAVDMLEKLKDYYPVAVYLLYLADVYAEQNQMDTAISTAKRSLEMARQYTLKDQISAANLKLSELEEIRGNSEAALGYYREHITYRDSIRNLEAIESMADLRTTYEVSQKQAEVDLLNQEKKNQQILTISTVIAALAVGFVAFMLYRRNRFIKKTNQIINTEKERSDQLLLNILPEETAIELKLKGRVAAKRFDAVTVLFSDFVGFTSYAAQLSPEELVETVDYYFSAFDKIMQRYGLEKIKTIGDAYMCAGGIPFPTEDHAYKIILAAMDMVKFVERAYLENPVKDFNFQIRLGVSTGPVVAGIVGSTKFAYDIWGDTVNIASRMESYSEAGKINISEDTYHLVKNRFHCEYRGKIEAKNRGQLNMYYVTGIKSEADREEYERLTETYQFSQS